MFDPEVEKYIEQFKDVKLSDLNKVTRKVARRVYNAMVNELRGWDIRSAFPAGVTSAVVYVTFLKFLSDRREALGLLVSDLYRADALPNLYPNVINQKDSARYVDGIERQFGFSSRLLETFVLEIREDNIERKFRTVLQIANHLDFATEDGRNACLDELMITVENLAISESKQSDTSYTPAILGTFMERICEISDGMSVYDPCAGMGVAASEIVRNHKVGIYVQEIQKSNAAVAEMLLIMNGMTRGRVQCDDTLLHPLSRTLNEKFDRVVCEPPYLKPTSGDMRRENNSLIGHMMYYPEMNISNSWAFIRHIIASLNDTGRAVVLVPMSMLTRESSFAEPRKRLIEDGYIEGVIELPGGILATTGIKYSILLLRKQQGISQGIYMMDLSNGLWDEKVKKAKSPEDGLAQLAEMVVKREIKAGISEFVPISEVAENRFQLAVARYIKQEIDVEKFISDSAKVFEEMDSLNNQYNKLQNEFMDALSDYNNYLNRRSADELRV